MRAPARFSPGRKSNLEYLLSRLRLEDKDDAPIGVICVIRGRVFRVFRGRVFRGRVIL